MITEYYDNNETRYKNLLENTRAGRLLLAGEKFLVVKQDEPYFKEVYSMIKIRESQSGTWTAEDEKQFVEAIVCPYDVAIEKVRVRIEDLEYDLQNAELCVTSIIGIEKYLKNLQSHLLTLQHSKECGKPFEFVEVSDD